jgi:cytochrome c
MQTYARIALSSVALVLLYAGVPPTRAGDASTSGVSGQAAFNNNCRTCHSTKEGDNRLGPSLSHIVGAKAAARSGYANYSQAMRAAGITWDEQTLDRFIANPESVVPNNNMKPFKSADSAPTHGVLTAFHDGVVELAQVYASPARGRPPLLR